LRCKSFCNFKSWGTPWPWQKLHRNSRTLRQRSASARSQFRTPTIDWFHVSWGELVPSFEY
jgi:hypothetical protein